MGVFRLCYKKFRLRFRARGCHGMGFRVKGSGFGDGVKCVEVLRLMVYMARSAWLRAKGVGSAKQDATKFNDSQHPMLILKP